MGKAKKSKKTKTPIIDKGAKQKNPDKKKGRK